MLHVTLHHLINNFLPLLKLQVPRYRDPQLQMGGN